MDTHIQADAKIARQGKRQPKAYPKLICPGCKKSITAGCHCGVAYQPPRALAEAAIKADPKRSNNSIAETENIDEGTVRNARKRLGPEYSEPGQRIDKNGKKQSGTKRSKRSKRSNSDMLSATELVATLAESGAINPPKPPISKVPNEIVLAIRYSLDQLNEVVNETELRADDRQQLLDLAEELVVFGHRLRERVDSIRP